MDNALPLDARLLQELLQAIEPEEKAAIVAEALFTQLPAETALIARRCSVLHWFDERIIEALLQDRPKLIDQRRSIYDQLKTIPFVEALPWGLAFNALTREGLLRLYTATQPDLLKDAARLVAPAYQRYGDDDKILAEALFCYSISGEVRAAQEVLDTLLQKASVVGNWEYLHGLISLMQEAHRFPFVQPLLLSEMEARLKLNHRIFEVADPPSAQAQQKRILPGQSVIAHDPVLEGWFSRTPEGRYERSEIELVLAIRALLKRGEHRQVQALCEVLLQRCTSEFLRYTQGLRRRPELREEAIANMGAHLLREAQNPHETFMTQNFMHSLRWLCVEEFNIILRRDLIGFQESQLASSDDEWFAARNVANPHDQYEVLHAEVESRRILAYLQDPLDRKIMILRLIEGMRWDDIAQICKRTERTVRLRYERARNYLQKCMANERSLEESASTRSQPENPLGSEPS
jgi:hypothetical protein